MTEQMPFCRIWPLAIFAPMPIMYHFYNIVLCMTLALCFAERDRELLKIINTAAAASEKMMDNTMFCIRYVSAIIDEYFHTYAQGRCFLMMISARRFSHTYFSTISPAMRQRGHRRPSITAP